MQSNRIFSKIVFSALCGALFFGGCLKEEQQVQQQVQAIPVTTYTTKKQDVGINFEYPAKLKSLQSVDVYARVSGTLLKQNFIEGGFVKEGDKLFKIDPLIYQANYNMAKAQVASANATLQSSSRDWERAKRLFAENALSPKEYDSAKSAYESANAALQSARAQRDIAKIDLDYTDVIATASGKISMTRFDIGDLVGGANGSILTTITRLDPIYAEFSIPNNDYYFIRTLDRDALKVKYVLANGEDYKKEGKLDFVDSVINEGTATIKARAIVDNAEHLLVPGEFSRIKLEGFLLKDAIVIPQDALMQDAKGSYVYKIVDGKAQPTPIVLGHEVGNNIVVQKGLEGNEMIITSQLIKIRPGAPVTPMGK